MINKVKPLIKQYGIFYFIGVVIILGIKYFYSLAGSDDLEWILTPTVRWIKMISGITFEKEPLLGYINHQYRFIIAPICSGVQFMIITFALLFFSFIHYMNTIKRKFYWVGLSLVFSYLLTIFVNGFRIALSLYFLRQELKVEWITPEQLHMLEGTAIYFVALLFIYHITGFVLKKIAGIQAGSICVYSEKSFIHALSKCIPAGFWYFFITLGIPIINSAYKNNSEKFKAYAITITAVCLVIIIIFCLLYVLREYFLRGTHKVKTMKRARIVTPVLIRRKP